MDINIYHLYVPEMWSEIPGTVKILFFFFYNILSDLVEVSGNAPSCSVCEVEEPPDNNYRLFIKKHLPKPESSWAITDLPQLPSLIKLISHAYVNKFKF